jgi:hypothetical protein
MKRYNNAPKFMTAKYAGVCAETGKPIKVGDKILYSGGKAYTEDSQSYRDYASAEFDRVWMGQEY